MKKVIIIGSLAAGLLALAAWRMRQSRKSPEDDFAIPDEFTVPTPQKEEPAIA
jgi:hypothetical protein